MDCNIMNSLIQLSPSKLLTCCNKLGIKTGVEYVIDENGNKKYKRIILSLKRNSNAALYGEINGLIINCETKQLVCIGPKICIETDESPQLKNYTILRPIYDGTIVNIYYYNDEWHISTSDGYSVGAFTGLRGDITFLDALIECGLVFADLDKTKCYTYGFNHKSFHLYPEKRNPLWRIQEFDLQKFNCFSAKTTDDNACVKYDDCVLSFCEPCGVRKCINEFGCIYEKNGIQYLYKTELMKKITNALYDLPNRFLYYIYKDRYVIYRAALNPSLSYFVDLCPQTADVINTLNSLLCEFAKFLVMANKIKHKKKLMNNKFWILYTKIMENSAFKTMNFLDLEIESVVLDLLKSERFIQYYLDFF